ncbi:MAG: peptidoglycan binding domain-containing protein [Chloroflexota bacterium]
MQTNFSTRPIKIRPPSVQPADFSTQPIKTHPLSVQPASRVKLKHKERKLGRVTLTILSLLVILSSVALVILFNINRIIIPGVFIYDRDISLQTQTQTAAQIDQIWNQDAKIVLGNDTQQFMIKSADLGLVTDADATAQLTYEVGRGADAIQELKTLIQTRSIVILPVVHFDSEQARQLLEALSVTISTPAQEAQLSFQNGEWVAQPGQTGITLNVDETIATIEANPTLMALTGYIPLIMMPVQPNIADYSTLLADITFLLEQDYKLRAYDPITDEHFEWSVPDELIASWVYVDYAAGEVHLEPKSNEVLILVNKWDLSLGSQREISLPAGINKLVQAWQSGQNTSANVFHKATQYVVDTSDSLWSISLKLGMPMWRIMDANPELTASNLEAGMELIIPPKNILLPLPVIENKRIVISISEQHMWTYENGQLRSEHIISTGMSNSPTMAGIFQVQSHELNAYASRWDLWMPHFMGIYEAWPSFMNGIHGLPLLSSGNRLWESNLGTPISYGCIILDLEAGESLYYWAEDGVIVEIIP